MSLPAPENYSDWQSWARATNRVLQDSGFDPLLPQGAGSGVPGGGGGGGGGGPATSVTLPDGYRPVWLSAADAKLFLGNDSLDPPTAPDLFQIDNLNLLDAVISTNKVQASAIDASKILDGAVSTLELAAGAVTTAKIAALNITSGLIAGGAVGSSQLADLGVINAKIGNAAVQTAQIADAAIVNAKLGVAAVLTANIQDAAIVNAKILDSTILTAKISDAAISTAKIANAAIVSALIGDLQVITAKIADLAVNNAKIANLSVNSAKIANLSVGTAQIIDLAVNAAKIALATITNAQIADATITTAKIGSAQITQALIALLAVGTAQIIDGSILNAKIADGTILNAKIADAAITNAKIADATILSAKIGNLVVDKLLSGNLNATIDVGTGILKFTIGGYSLYIGRGFGTSSQFFLWYGPTPASPAAATEAAGVIFFKTDGSAYFGGDLRVGILTSRAGTSNLSATASCETGPFGSNGDPILVSFSYSHSSRVDSAYPATTSGVSNFDSQAAFWGATSSDGINYSGSGSTTETATVNLDRDVGGGFSTVASINVSAGSYTWTGVRPSIPDSTAGSSRLIRTMGGSNTYTDAAGGTANRNFRASLAARSVLSTSNETQNLSIVTTEQ